MSDVFISYSRKDKEFVSKLHEYLLNQNQDVWIDWQSIPPSQKWWDEIKTGIAKANNFVVVLSPDSMGSPICQMEIEYARQRNKRIIPVLHIPYEREVVISTINERLTTTRESTTREIWGERQTESLFSANEAVIRRINYFYLKPETDFESRFNDLFLIICTDYEYKEKHTTLELRALEWDRRNRDVGFLLIENELLDAQTWLKSAVDKEPTLTDLQHTYILASEKRDKQLRNIRRASIIGSTVAVIALIFAVGASIIGVQANDNANAASRREAQANIQATEANRQVAIANNALTAVPPTLTLVGEQVMIALGQANQANTQVSIARSELTSIPPTLAAVATEVKASENFADGVQLAIRSQDIYTRGQPQLGLALALEATYIDVSTQTQRILRELAYQPNVRRQFEGHTEKISAVTFSPDGSMLLSGAINGEVILWDIHSGDILHHFRGMRGQVSDIIFHSNGNNILAASNNGVIIIWDIATGTILKNFRVSAIPNMIFNPFRVSNNVIFNQSSNIIFSGSTDGVISMWDIETEKLVANFSGSKSIIHRMIYSPDGKFLLASSSSSDSETSSDLILWDVESQEILQHFTGYTGIIDAMEFSSDGKKIITSNDGFLDDEFLLWDVESGKILQRFTGHTREIWNIDFSSDGSQIITSGGDIGNDELILWDAESGNIIQQFEGYVGWVGHGLFSPNYRQVVVSNDSILILWDLENGQIIKYIENNIFLLRSIDYNIDTKQILLGSVDGSIILFSNNDENPTYFQGYTAPVSSVAFSQDNNFILSSSLSGEIIIWEISTNTIFKQIQLEEYSSSIKNYDFFRFFNYGGIYALQEAAFSPNRQLFASRISNTIYLWEVATGKLLHQFQRDEDSILNVIFSPNGQQILSSSGQRLILWDVFTGEMVHSFIGNQVAIRSLAFSADGQTILTGGGFITSGELLLWDVTSGNIIQRFENQKGGILSVSLSPDGQTALSGSDDGKVTVWDVNTGSPLQSFITQQEQVGIHSVEYNSDGTEIIVVQAYGTIFIWRNDTINQLHEWVTENRYIQELTCEERLVFRTRLCVNGNSP